MKFRHILALLSALALFTLTAAPADAATGPKRLQKLAQAQTGLLLAHYDGGIASPAVCGEGQGRNGVAGAFLLPTLSFRSGVVRFRCATKARSVVVDLGGAVVTEDANQSSTWTLATGETLRFSAGNLERICDDILARPDVIGASATGTVDGRPITAVPVSTREFTARVTPAAVSPPFWDDSVALGHPGRLAASFCGFKAELKLTPGRHVIRVDHSARIGEQTVLTYVIDVRR